MNARRAQRVSPMCGLDRSLCGTRELIGERTPQSKSVSLDDQPMHAYRMSTDMQYIEPKARVY